MFYQGVVENNVDPKKLGRVQCRIIGLHSENRTDQNDSEYLPTSNLPWCEAAFPIFSPGISGVSTFAIPMNGSLVWIFFKDPQLQYPVYFAVSARIPKEQPDFEKGFSDPNKEYPKSDFIGEVPMSRLMRAEKLDQTIVQQKKENRDIFQVNNEQLIEPITPYAAKYPHNKVMETSSGHIIEVDDTPGSERINLHHKSGTFIEIHPDGTVVNKIVNRSVVVIKANGDCHIHGTNNVRIDGNANISVGTDAIIGIGRDAFVSVGRHTGMTGAGNAYCDIGGNCKIKAARIDLNP